MVTQALRGTERVNTLESTIIEQMRDYYNTHVLPSATMALAAANSIDYQDGFVVNMLAVRESVLLMRDTWFRYASEFTRTITDMQSMAMHEGALACAKAIMSQRQGKVDATLYASDLDSVVGITTMGYPLAALAQDYTNDMMQSMMNAAIVVFTFQRDPLGPLWEKCWNENRVKLESLARGELRRAAREGTLFVMRYA